MSETENIANHQVKVDNWPLFFLQRLNHFYRKKSHCDLTLMFSTLDAVKTIKVHKLVLHACTDYFESLDIMTDSEHGEFLQLSNEMQPDVVIPIIGFMYTGKLEFPVTLKPRLYEAATKLRMTILTKLLDVQSSKTSNKFGNQPTEEPLTKVSLKKNESLLSTQNVINNNQDGQELVTSSSDVSLLQGNYSSNSLNKQIEEPVVTLIPVSVKASQPNQNLNTNMTLVQWSDIATGKTNNQSKPKSFKKNVGLQLATVNTKPKVLDVSLPPTLPGRKLPVWKRKVPLSGSQFLTENIQNVRTTYRSTEKAKPTRFEWEEDLNDLTSLKPVEDALKTLSYDGSVKISYPIILDPESTIQRNDYSSDDSLRQSFEESPSESPPYKRSRQSELQDMKEYGKQQQLRNEIICSEENADDLMDTDDLYGQCEDEAVDISNFNVSNANSSTPKPILKTIFKPEPPASSKKVRFSLEGKENNQQQNEISTDFTVATSSASSTTNVTISDTKQPDQVVSKQKIVLPMNVSQLQSGKHHVKIVSEVLKKYPNLAKRENIKLRVVSKNPAAVPPAMQQAVEGDVGTGTKSSSSLVSYIFLTNKSSSDLPLAKNGQNEKDKLFDVENKTGPWFCHVCEEINPIEFESYYTYRRHLVEVHELKIDARICEYCGLRNSKRNHLLYHLYTKHGIHPPAHVSFPKCSECDYIALSDALLVKHKSTHDPKSLTCYTCNVVFKSYSSMQIHLQSTWHKNKLNEVSVVVLSDYPCPFCEDRFENGTKLKDHIESTHHSQKITQREGKQIYRCPYCEALFGNGDKLGKHIVTVHWRKNNQIPDQRNQETTFEPQSGQQLQYTEEAENTNTVDCTNDSPSSELESLSNVASGIATSLSLVGNEQTVVYYEQRAEEQDIGGEATVIAENDCNGFLISTPLEEIDNNSSKIENDSLKSLTVESEDSNSRMSNCEELNRTTCSDHDYSEPQSDDHLRQMIPMQSVANPLSEDTVIQQILPDQSLVFSNEANVVFQSSCVSLPPRVLLTSGNMVLPHISHAEPNVILSKVIPQASIILSGQILQQPGGIIDDNSSIMFANPPTSGSIDNIQAAIQHYSIEKAQKEDGSQSEDVEVGQVSKMDNAFAPEMESATAEEEKNTTEKKIDNSVVKIVENVEIEENEQSENIDDVGNVHVQNNQIDNINTDECNQSEKMHPEEEEGEEEEENVVVNNVCQEKTKENDNITEVEILNEKSAEFEESDSNKDSIDESSLMSISKSQNRLETSKIVDDWDETNDSQQNIESKSDGPSRPDFF